MININFLYKINFITLKFWTQVSIPMKVDLKLYLIELMQIQIMCLTEDMQGCWYIQGTENIAKSLQG